MSSAPISRIPHSKLKFKALIHLLFADGKTIREGSFSLKFLLNPTTDSPSIIQWMPLAPKRRFKRAVDRNLIKRRIREAFVNNHKSLANALSEKDFTCLLSISYQGVVAIDQNTLEEKIILLLNRLSSRLD